MQEDASMLKYRFYTKEVRPFVAEILFDGHPYRLAYEGEIPGDAGTLTTAVEDLFTLFNNHPDDYQGRSMSVGDVVGFTTPEGDRVAFLCDTLGWKYISEQRVMDVAF